MGIGRFDQPPPRALGARSDRRLAHRSARRTRLPRAERPTCPPGGKARRDGKAEADTHDRRQGEALAARSLRVGSYAEDGSDLPVRRYGL
jgi:hypothetical protein